MSIAPTALDVQHVSKRFGGTQALNDVSLRVTGGTIHAVIGPNGAGKSTLINVVSGLSQVEEAKLRLMRSLAASRAKTLTKVKLPDAMPTIFAGLKTAIVLAVVGAVVGEFVGAESGLGYVIKQSEFQLDVAQTFAVIVLLSSIGIALFYAIEFVERRALFWTRPSH